MSLVKYRLREVAADFGVTPKEISEIVAAHFEKPKSNTQVLTEDELNTLTSVWGQYTPDNNQALFSDSVRLVHPKFVLESDTLCYNTATYQADLVSQTRIVYEHETTILSSKGWYNTQTEHSMLLDRSLIVHTDGPVAVSSLPITDRSKLLFLCQ